MVFGVIFLFCGGGGEGGAPRERRSEEKTLSPPTPTPQTPRPHPAALQPPSSSLTLRRTAVTRSRSPRRSRGTMIASVGDSTAWTNVVAASLCTQSGTSEGRAMHDTSAGMNFSMSMLSTVLHTVESAAIAASLTCCEVSGERKKEGEKRERKRGELFPRSSVVNGVVVVVVEQRQERKKKKLNKKKKLVPGAWRPRRRTTPPG